MTNSQSDTIICDGEVSESLPNTLFRVKLSQEFGGKVLLCHVSGKMRKHFIKILPGDRVKVEVSRYDLTRGKICFRS